MDKEYVDELKQLNAAIRHYKKQLKAKPFKFYFSKEDSHDIAKRMIADKQERVKEIKSYYEKWYFRNTASLKKVSWER